MNTWLEKLALTLFLLLGLNTYAVTHAATTAEEFRAELVQECPVQGHVNLRLNGTIQNGRLDGYVNNQFVWWNVVNGSVTGFINGHYLSLTIEAERNEYLLTGWIGTNYIRWISFGGQFNEWVYC